MNLPYTKIIQEKEDKDGKYFFGRILEIDGCQSTNKTLEGLFKDLDEVMEGYFEVMEKKGLPIPMPKQLDDYSGKFVVRLPKSLHQKLTIEAKREGISLNQLAVSKLARE